MLCTSSVTNAHSPIIPWMQKLSTIASAMLTSSGNVYTGLSGIGPTSTVTRIVPAVKLMASRRSVSPRPYDQ